MPNPIDPNAEDRTVPDGEAPREGRIIEYRRIDEKRKRLEQLIVSKGLDVKYTPKHCRTAGLPLDSATTNKDILGLVRDSVSKSRVRNVGCAN